MAATRIWIMDGHNMIFAIGPLTWLQESGRRDEARQGLVDRLRPFARTRCEKVLIVFDGLDLERNLDVIQEPFFEAVYARRSDGEADDRIIHEAKACLEQGHRVTVVTNDLKTLAGELPEGAHHLGVQAFWRKYIEEAAGRTGKRVEGDFSDVESEMEALAAKEVSEPHDRNLAHSHQAGALRSAAGSVRPGRAGKRTAPTSRSVIQEGAAATESVAEGLRRKKEKGRLRQERRLKRRANPGRR
jgi:predicted RNA-binding protein with PIN domain